MRQGLLPNRTCPQALCRETGKKARRIVRPPSPKADTGVILARLASDSAVPGPAGFGGNPSMSAEDASLRPERILELSERLSHVAGEKIGEIAYVNRSAKMLA